MVYMGKLTVIGVKRSENVAPIATVLPASDDRLELQKPWEFQQYVLWCNLPSYLKRPPKDKKGNQPTALDFCMSMGIEDPAILELAQIPTNVEFSAKYGVHINTLTRWRREIGERDLISDIRQWAEPLTKNVAMSLYNATLRGGLPQHYELWFNFVNNWNKKISVDVRKRVIKTVTVRVVDTPHGNTN